MLQYKNFTFNTKENFLNYIEKRMIGYWKAHNDSFSRVCEELDSWNGFLGDDRIYFMDEIDELLCDKKPSEVLQMVDTANFDISDDYFYYDIYGIRSTNEKDYYNYVDYSEVFDELIDNYGRIFSYRYGNAYYELFNDIYNINRWNIDEIQECMNYGCYDYLFVDDDDFFSDDDLDD